MSGGTSTIVEFSGKQPDWNTWRVMFLARAALGDFKRAIIEENKSESEVKDNTIIRSNEVAYLELLLSMQRSSPICVMTVCEAVSKKFPGCDANMAWKNLCKLYIYSSSRRESFQTQCLDHSWTDQHERYTESLVLRNPL